MFARLSILKTTTLGLFGVLILFAALGWGHFEWEQYHAYSVFREILSTVNEKQSDKELSQVLVQHGLSYSDNIIYRKFRSVGFNKIVEQRCFFKFGCGRHFGYYPVQSSASGLLMQKHPVPSKEPLAYDKTTSIGAGGDFICARDYVLDFFRSYETHRLELYVWSEQVTCL